MSNSNSFVIVTRHPAVAQFIKECLPEFEDAPVLTSATPDDVRGKVAAGNLPLHLARFARLVITVEFHGDPPQCGEYTIDDMRTAGAYLGQYVVYAVVGQEPTYPDGSRVVGHQGPQPANVWQEPI